jgi:hypothetical protein
MITSTEKELYGLPVSAKDKIVFRQGEVIAYSENGRIIRTSPPNEIMRAD